MTAVSQNSVTTPEPHQWRRADVDEAGWNGALVNLASGKWTLFGLWGEVDRVYLAVMTNDGLCILSLATKEGAYPSVAAQHPPATRLERMIHDLFGLRAIGSIDQRPWVDHGRWGVKHPLGAATHSANLPSPYQFSPVEGPGMHQVAVGPVHAGI